MFQLWLRLALGAGVAATLAVGAALAATPSPASEPTVTNLVIAAASPALVTDPELAISMVTIPPGGAIPPHVHPGTQIGAIAAGDLTYSVLTGAVEIQRNGGSEDSTKQTVAAGTTVILEAGDAVIETPGAAHQARNDGDEPVVIWLSTLFPAGAPRADLVAASPTP